MRLKLGHCFLTPLRFLCTSASVNGSAYCLPRYERCGASRTIAAYVLHEIQVRLALLLALALPDTLALMGDGKAMRDGRRGRRILLVVASLALTLSACVSPSPGPTADTPLTSTPGDPQRGRAIALSREAACTLCHAFPGVEGIAMGNVGPSLAEVGKRRSLAELRSILVDASRFNPETIMPPYHRTAGLTRVAPAYAGKPILSREDVEDVVAYLAQLQ